MPYTTQPPGSAQQSVSDCNSAPFVFIFKKLMQSGNHVHRDNSDGIRTGCWLEDWSYIPTEAGNYILQCVWAGTVSHQLPLNVYHRFILAGEDHN